MDGSSFYKLSTKKIHCINNYNKCNVFVILFLNVNLLKNEIYYYFHNRKQHTYRKSFRLKLIELQYFDFYYRTARAEYWEPNLACCTSTLNFDGYLMVELNLDWLLLASCMIVLQQYIHVESELDLWEIRTMYFWLILIILSGCQLGGIRTRFVGNQNNKPLPRQIEHCTCGKVK